MGYFSFTFPAWIPIGTEEISIIYQYWNIFLAQQDMRVSFQTFTRYFDQWNNAKLVTRQTSAILNVFTQDTIYQHTWSIKQFL